MFAPSLILEMFKHLLNKGSVQTVPKNFVSENIETTKFINATTNRKKIFCIDRITNTEEEMRLL